MGECSKWLPWLRGLRSFEQSESPPPGGLSTVGVSPLGGHGGRERQRFPERPGRSAPADALAAPGGETESPVNWNHWARQRVHDPMAGPSAGTHRAVASVQPRSPQAKAQRRSRRRGGWSKGQTHGASGRASFRGMARCDTARPGMTSGKPDLERPVVATIKPTIAPSRGNLKRPHRCIEVPAPLAPP